MTANARAAFRLGLAPVLLLGWNMRAGDPLPFLGPSLLVTILVTASPRPSLALLARLFAVVVGLTWGLDTLFGIVADSPGSAWLALFAVAAFAFGRLARRPGDMLATMALIAASMVTVIRDWAQGSGVGVPWLVARATAQAIAVALLAHALLPSPPAAAGAAAAAPALGRASAVQAFGRAAGLLAVLGTALLRGDPSAILVALTAVNVLAAPALAAGRAQGRALLLANAAAGALALPLLAVAAVAPNEVVLPPLALAANLWLARGIGAQGMPRLIACAGVPVFVVLLGLLLPQAGDTALPALADRLLTLILVMLYALGVLALLRPRPNAEPALEPDDAAIT